MIPRILKRLSWTVLIISGGCGGKELQHIPGPSMAHIYPDHRLTATARKTVTEAFLKKNRIAVTAQLDLLPDYTTVRLRDSRSAARKAVVLFALTNVAFHYREAGAMTDYLKKYKLWDEVPERAKLYLALAVRTAKDDNPYIWRSESFNTLFWALGHFKTLPFPSAPCDITRYGDLPDLDEDPAHWINSARLRNSEDILNEIDLVARLHMAAYFYINNNRPKGLLNEDVLSERRLALDWLLIAPFNSEPYTKAFF